MAELVLHHYELSPFSEKIRRVLAFKGLPWASVRAPAVMPKPDIVALTGGYRKIPILQIDNHVYCDTALIAKVIERRAPAPTLYPKAFAGTVEALAEWFDRALFETAVPFVGRPTRFDEAMRLLTQDELMKIGQDRAAMREGGRIKPLGFKSARARLALYLSRLEEAVSNQDFVLGATPCIADFAAYHTPWLLEKIAPEPLEGRARLRAWMDRVAALPLSEPETLTSDGALALARRSTAEWKPEAPFSDPTDLSPGQRVTVRADDYGCDPVEGTLAHATAETVTVRREDERAGVVFVHFPRVGYEIAAV